MRTNGLTDRELKALAELVLAHAEEVPDVAGAADTLARMCRWRGHRLADLARGLERVAAENRATREPVISV